MTASGKAPVGNLPAELTSFVGRRAELADVKQALGTARLVTLIGAGGVGKTRLALRAAGTVRRAFRDGAWLVDLAPLRDEQLLGPTIAATLGLQSASAWWAPAALGDQLASRAMLLVLDNCEHVSEAAAVMVEALLSRCPDLRVLVTSRQPLDIPGEYLVAIHPLQSPPYRDRRGEPDVIEQFDAVRLFVERARALEPRFGLTPENAASIAELCYRLDGLPLAIELAAARVRHLSTQQILARLDPGYGLLSSRSSVTPPRQRSLRSLVEWSHELCDLQEQRLWSRLSVFAGSFTAESAEAVCADRELPLETVLPTLSSLVDKSIVSTDPTGAEMRYRMLEVIRSFGHERLVAAGEEPAVRRNHRSHFARALLQSHPQWFGPDQLQHLRFCQQEWDNLRAAIDFSLDDGDDGVAAATILATALGGAAIVSGLHAEARHWAEKVLEVAVRPGRGLATLLWVDGSRALQQGDLVRAGALLDQAVDVASRLDDPHEIGMALAFQGMVRLRQDQPQEALEAFRSALATAGDAPDPMVQAIVHVGMAAAADRLGDLDQAMAWCREAIATSDASAEEWHKAEALCLLGDLLRQQGSAAEAEEAVLQALQLRLTFHNAPGIAECFSRLAAIAGPAGEWERAARLLGAADALRLDSDVRLRGHLVQHSAEVAAQAGQALGEVSFDELRTTGVRGPLEDNVAYAQRKLPTGRVLPVAAGPRLTRREREIADLIMTGASNKDIAATLVISPRTAEGHVVHILDKLGFTSRAQIAAWASRESAPG
jgi:predicted ATPase/DNA-binding CsgD family transcriptional regulator